MGWKLIGPAVLSASFIVPNNMVSRVVIRSDSSAFSTTSNASSHQSAPFTSSRLLAQPSPQLYSSHHCALLALTAPKPRESDLIRSENRSSAISIAAVRDCKRVSLC